MLLINSFPSGAEGGSGVPSGGTKNQVLTKNSSTDGDVIWKTPADTSKFFSTDDAAYTAIDNNDFIPVHDTSASTKMRSSWGNMKSLLKTYFDTLYQAPITAGANLSFNGNTLDASYPLMVNEFNKSDLYSTTEKVVGCWIDGRPIYQKTFSKQITTNVQDDSEVKDTITHGITNIQDIVDIKGIERGDDSWINIFSPSSTTKGALKKFTVSSTTYNNVPSAGDGYFQVTANKTEILITTQGNFGSNNVYVYVTLKYTKTTDVANSFNYASENDYSATEKIVGTWIDGKPLYQKTVSCGTLPNNVSKATVHNISNLKRVVKVFGYAYRTSDNRNIPLPYSSPVMDSSSNACVQVNVDTTNITIRANRDYSAFTESYITIQYTKTTD